MKNAYVGAFYTVTSTVKESDLASAYKSGNINVYATPAMIALMEEAACLCLAKFLDEGETSVGTAINVSHISATPVGVEVTATATISSSSGRLVSFDIAAKDAYGDIGTAKHTRFVVDADRFMKKTSLKGQ